LKALFEKYKIPGGFQTQILKAINSSKKRISQSKSKKNNNFFLEHFDLQTRGCRWCLPETYFQNDNVQHYYRFIL